MQRENVILRGLVFHDEVSLAVLDTTNLVNDAIRTHGLSPLAAAALGRTLTVAAYMCSSLKTENSALSVNIRGDGVGGYISVSGDKLLHMRGYIDHPTVQLPPKAPGKLDVGGCVGKNGYLSVVRDDGEGVPFVGTTELVSGEIGEDFATYFAYSEQLPTAIAVGVKIGTDGVCVGAGGVILQPLPGASEESLAAVDEAMRAFGAISSMIEQGSAQEIAEKYFGNVKYYTLKPEYKCNCSRNYIEGVLLSMGERELRESLAAEGKISVHCHYCNRDYDFSQEEIERLIAEGKLHNKR